MSRSILAAVAACALAAAPEAAADAKFVKLVNADGGRVLAVADNSDESGARAVVAKDDGGEAQQWQLEKDGDYYKLVNRKSGKVLDVYEESTEEGTQIIQWEDKADGNDNQRWAWDGTGEARRLKSKSSGLVLDIEDGKVIQRKANEKAKSQLWRVVEVKK
jgi:Ricin-type beta-trefoil lectin domain-like